MFINLIEKSKKHYMNKIFNIILIIFSIVAVSCEEVAKNIDLSEGDPELVVQSYLSPNDTSVVLILTLSKPIYQVNSGSSEYTLVNNATVRIADDNHEYQLKYNSDLRCYFSSQNQIPIIPGKTYKLFISTPDGKKVESSCVIPAQPNVSIDLIQIDSTPGWNGEMIYNKKIKFTNNSNTFRYFAIYRRYFSVSEFKSDTFFYMQRENMLEVKPNTAVNFSLSDYYFSEFGPTSNTIDDSLLVYQLDEAYYRYHYTIENANFGNPFAEAVITYSNITNGIGVFCGYNKKFIIVKK